MRNFGYTDREIRIFRKLNTPQKIQDFINKIPFNFDEGVGKCLSPRMVLREGKADCVEGAILAAAILEYHGHKPLLIDLRSVKRPYDYDHVIAVFQIDKFFGAISKTNHSVLRYREPIYRDIQELVMSYFHEYFLDSGKKTLREYSEVFDLNFFNNINWRTSGRDLEEVMDKLDKIKHYKILTKKQEKNLRKADKIEIESTQKTEYSPNEK